MRSRTGQPVRRWTSRRCRLPDHIHAAEVKQDGKPPRLQPGRGMRGPQRDEWKRDLRSIEILDTHSGVRPGDCAHSIGENFRIVEFVRTALGYQACGYWGLKKILKLDVAGAIEETGRGEIQAHTPQRQSASNMAWARRRRGFSQLAKELIQTAGFTG